MLSSGERPSLPELLRLKVDQRVGANYPAFGIFLLNDETGVHINAIEDECRGKADRIVLRILQQWLEGKGLPVSWEVLVKTLRDTKLTVLADEIQGSKIPAEGRRGEREVYTYSFEPTMYTRYQGVAMLCGGLP